jgi:hypothetical protein
MSRRYWRSAGSTSAMKELVLYHQGWPADRTATGEAAGLADTGLAPRLLPAVCPQAGNGEAMFVRFVALAEGAKPFSSARAGSEYSSDQGLCSRSAHPDGSPFLTRSDTLRASRTRAGFVTMMIMA